MNKRIVLSFLSIFFVFYAGAAGQRPLRHAKDLPDLGSWAPAAFARGTVPPFSFCYGEASSESLLPRWRFSATRAVSAEGCTERSYTWTDPATGLQIECRTSLYGDFNAMEWVLYMRNTGSAPTPRISSVRTADFYQQSTLGGDRWQVYHYDGARDGGHDFKPHTRDFAVGDTLELYPHAGRSSSWCMPYFNVLTPAGGVMVAVGWTGDWVSEVERPRTDRMRVRAGLRFFDASLNPGEEIRLPSTVIMPWAGEDRMEGQNRWRRMVLEHFFPRVHGERVQVPLLNNFANNDDPWPCDEYTCSTDFYDIAIVRKQQLFGTTVDGYWLDAGWYSRAFDAESGYWWHSSVGNWTPDPLRYPDGLSPVADAVHASGGKFMVWYEPERANVDSDWAHEYPEFMLSQSGERAEPVNEVVDSAFIVNLGNPAARKWLTDYMVQHLSDSKVDIYRQDFNIEPQDFWHAADAPGREGMTEVLYINGLYAYLDSLRARLPHLVIDNCAGGGRRLDIEMYRRSIPMWRDDHEGSHESHQSITYNLSQWLPVHCTATSYPWRIHYLSTLGAGTVFCWGDTNRASIPQEKQVINCFREYSPYFLEDFYPLTGYDDLCTEDRWLAYQLHRPSDDSGIVLAFKRKECADSVSTFALRALAPEALYSVQEVEHENALRGDIRIRTLWGIIRTEENSSGVIPEPVTLTGESLGRGFTVSIGGKQGVRMFRYRKIDNK